MSTNRKLVILILVTSFVLIAAGLTCGPSQGDEVYHYRFAKDIFNAGKRVAFDSLYGSGNSPGYFYNSEPLWSSLLAMLWYLFGKISFGVAQVYHSIYYVLLVLFVYLLGKELYGQKQGLYAALIVATMPVVVAFSILFYLDIPATSLSMLCILLFVKRKYFWSGVALGLMYFTKRNACFFAPAFFFLILMQKEVGFRKKVQELFYFFIPVVMFILPDIFWRENNLKSTVIINGNNAISQSTGTLQGTLQRFQLMSWSLKTTEYLNSYLSNPLDLIKYLGVLLLISLFLYVICKKYEKKDLILWVLIVFYYFFFCCIFNPFSDIRYLLPAIPLFAILSSKAITVLVNKKWTLILLLFLCLLQFGSTILYVVSKRQIPKEIKDGFNYIKNNTAADALIIYPEYVILEATNRRFVWTGNLPEVLDHLFWDVDIEKKMNLMNCYHINYIAIKKSRIYDDSQIHNFGGYPKSFVEKLPSFSFLKLMFDNSAMSVWKIENPQKTIDSNE